jgi:multicomponent K+:H+ antiporter subunit E
MKRWPSLTLFTAALFALWLLLNDTVSPGQLVLGVILTIGIALGTAAMRPLGARPHHLLVAIRLFFTVLTDIIRSNIAVARIILSPGRAATPGFMTLPIDLRDPYGLALLACIITATPGTIWAGLSSDGCILKIHVLDLKDEEAWIRTIKQRYERPLMEIFE